MQERHWSAQQLVGPGARACVHEIIRGDGGPGLATLALCRVLMLGSAPRNGTQIKPELRRKARRPPRTLRRTVSLSFFFHSLPGVPGGGIIGPTPRSVPNAKSVDGVDDSASFHDPARGARRWSHGNTISPTATSRCRCCSRAGAVRLSSQPRSCLPRSSFESCSLAVALAIAADKDWFLPPPHIVERLVATAGARFPSSMISLFNEILSRRLKTPALRCLFPGFIHRQHEGQRPSLCRLSCRRMCSLFPRFLHSGGQATAACSCTSRARS